MRVSRRGFVRLALGAATSLGLSGLAQRLLTQSGRSSAVRESVGHPLSSTARAAASPRVGAPTPPETAVAHTARKRRWVMVIDLARCDGCGRCTEACSEGHFVPQGQEWIKVYSIFDSAGGPYWLPRPCMQCDNPPCVKVCPVAATYKREDGIVIMDQDRCIGCRYCLSACPYSARFFNWAEPRHSRDEMRQPYSVEWNFPHRRGVVEKCIFCPALARQGRLPMCAEACPMNAIYFGDQYEDVVTNHAGEVLRFSDVLRQGAAFRLMEELGTEPRVYYLPPRNRQYPGPKEARS